MKMGKKKKIENLPRENPVELLLWGLKVGDIDEPRTAIKLAYRSEIVTAMMPVVKHFLAKSNKKILVDISELSNEVFIVSIQLEAGPPTIGGGGVFTAEEAYMFVWGWYG